MSCYTNGVNYFFQSSHKENKLHQKKKWTSSGVPLSLPATLPLIQHCTTRKTQNYSTHDSKPHQLSHRATPLDSSTNIMQSELQQKFTMLCRGTLTNNCAAFARKLMRPDYMRAHPALHNHRKCTAVRPKSHCNIDAIFSFFSFSQTEPQRDLPRTTSIVKEIQPFSHQNYTVVHSKHHKQNTAWHKSKKAG